MAISIEIEADSGLAIISCSGELTLEDARQAAVSLWSAPGWSGESAVWDFLMARFELSSSEVRRVAQFILGNQPDPPPSRMAFVAARDAEFGLARMFEVYRAAPGTRFRVFRDLPDAIEWARTGDLGASQP